MNEGFVQAAWAKLEQAGMNAMRQFARQQVAAIKESIAIPVERRGGYIIRSSPGEFPRRDKGDLWKSIKATDPVSMNHVIDVFIYTDVIHSAFLEFKDPDHGGRPWWNRSYQEMLDRQGDLKALFAENLGGQLAPAAV